MPRTDYRVLPLEALYSLLENSVTEMLNAYDNSDDNLLSFKYHKKQVELLLEIIKEKRLGLKDKPMRSNSI